MRNLGAKITKRVYNHLSRNKIHTTYWVDMEKDGEKFATGQTVSAK